MPFPYSPLRTALGNLPLVHLHIPAAPCSSSPLRSPAGGTEAPPEPPPGPAPPRCAALPTPRCAEPPCCTRDRLRWPCLPAAPARTSPSAAGTHRLLTGALPGPSRRLHARHSDLPCAQWPLLSPAPLRLRRPLECPLQWEPQEQPGLSLSSPGPPARARRCGCRRLAAPLFGGGADSCCRRRSAGPGGRTASAPPRPPTAPPAPGPARSPGCLPLSPPTVNNRRRQHKFRPPTRKLIGNRGPRGSDGKRIRAGGGSGAGTGRSRPGRGAWAASAAGGCGGQAAAGATEEGKAGREGAVPGRPPSPRSRGGPESRGAAPARRGLREHSSGAAARRLLGAAGEVRGVSRPGGAGREVLGRGAASRPSSSGRAAARQP